MNLTPIPMPDEIIRRVEELGRKYKQPKLLINTDKKGDDPVDHADLDDYLSYSDLSYESIGAVLNDKF